MKLLFYCILSYILISTTRSSIFTNFKANVLSLLNDDGNKRVQSRYIRPRAHYQKSPRNVENDETVEKVHYEIDPVLNSVRRNARRKWRRTFDRNVAPGEMVRFQMDPLLNSFRRQGKSAKPKKRAVSSSEPSSSSSQELRDWKDEWKEKWIHKKYEAINSSYVHGDTVNMLAARPWGVACGDPNQHDMPWGTCVLPMECDGEYRIYRGDYICGRSQFVCCALQITAYDMYQGFDLSFEESGLATDTQEKKKRGKGSKEGDKKHQKHERKKRRSDRNKRKRKIKRQIRKIQKEIKKLIRKQETNATRARKRKTKQLKKFIDLLKNQYKKDRKSVMDIHEVELIKIDDALKIKLQQIREMNQNFVKNKTFRDVVVNGTLNRQAARMLVEAYPELESYININVKRRSGGEVPEYLDNDVEFGMLYY